MAGKRPSAAASTRVRARWLAPAILALALVVTGCRVAAPGWTYAPPETQSPVALGAGAGGSPVGGPDGSLGASPATQATPAPSQATAAPGSPAPPTAAPSPGPTSGPPIIAARAARVPVLYYHRVVAPPPGFARWSAARRRLFLAYDVTPAAFAAQLDWLVVHGYTTILPRDLAAHWDSGTPLPAHPVIITFDDGTHDWASTVLSLLRERHMVAEFYVTLAAIPSGGMSWPELRALAAAGNGIGSHGVHHRQLTELGGKRPPVTEAVMRREVQRSRAILTAKLGVVPDSFAYVGGGFDATLERLVQEAGYTTARSILRGRVQRPDLRYALRVIRIGSRLDVTNVVRGTLEPGLPGFTDLMVGRTQ